MLYTLFKVYEKKIGDQVNMLSQSWDGKRIYYTSSLLGNWDKKEGTQGNVQYFKAYDWDGEQLKEVFAIDFLAEKIGRPHQMRFGARALYSSNSTPITSENPTVASILDN